MDEKNKNRNQENNVEEIPEKVSSFVSEQIKRKPINKRRLFRRTSFIITSAIIFGIIACITFLVLEPIVSNMLYPEQVKEVSIPDIQEEVSPDELLTEKDAEEEMTEAARVVAEEAAQSAIENAQASVEELSGVAFFEDLYDQLHDVASVAEQAIVKVTGVITETNWIQETVENENSVSGIIVAENGAEVLILADYVLLSDAQSYNVTFSDETIAKAELRCKDVNTGLGIFAVDYNGMAEPTKKNLTFAKLGNFNPDVMIGRFVIAIGSPMGDFGSISYGTVNSTGNTLKLADATYEIVCSDIHGSSQSNGVMINTNGEVIGLITKSSMEGMDNELIKAISISDSKKLIEKLSNNGSFAYAGVHGMDVTTTAHKDLGIPLGAYVSEVEPQSPAMNAGITRGDIIVRVDDEAITSFREYQSAVLKRSAGDVMWVTVARYDGVQYREISCEVTTKEIEK